MRVTPYALESLSSFINRAASIQPMDVRTYLRTVLSPASSDQYMNIPTDLDALADGPFLGQLNAALDPQKRRLAMMTLQGAEPGIHTKWLRRAGGCNIDGRDHFGAEPKLAWCPRCLLRDQLDGHDQFLRLSWRLITRTFCTVHRRPLTTHCLACNSREAGPAFAFDGRIVSLTCSACGSVYASQLGLPDMSGTTVLEIKDNQRVQVAWNGTVQLEHALQRGLSERSKAKNKREFHDFAFAFANMLMKADGHRNAPIDLFVSAAFPARRNPGNITSMDRPYRASSIAVRRKTHGLMAALFKCRVNLFAIKGLQQERWGREQFRFQCSSSRPCAARRTLLRAVRGTPSVFCIVRSVACLGITWTW
ncbi:TniQ family protein [Pseudaestuariivita rosea]|uniref:TniQ family protein n=1 Tax=Pseudaestuariivita rosea TaxID=2763263 RepID=UPI001ABA4041|nr:TniQ family protein [Pseudaestuariivita rosea]